MVTASVRRLWKRIPLSSANMGVLKAAVTIGLLTVVVKLSSMFKESFVAATYGTSDAFDAFVVASLIPTVVVNLISNSLNAALIPTYIRVRETESQADADRLYTTVLAINLGLLTFLSVAVALAAPLWLPLIASGYAPAKMAMAVRLVYWSMPLIIASGLATTWGSVLNAQERFGAVALAPAFQPIGIMLALALVSQYWGIGALVVGTLAGALLETGIVGYHLQKQGHHILPRWHGVTEHVRKVAGQYGATIGGAFFISSMGLVDQGMASMLGPGSNSALSYGMKIPMAFVGLGITALGTAVLPRFSKFASQGDWVEFRRTLWKYILVVGGLSILLACGLAAASEFITRVLYQRGHFSAQDTHLVSGVQFYYLLRLPIPITATLLVRSLNAMRANQVLATVAILQAILNVVLDWVLMKRLGAPGIAAASLGVSMVAFTCISISVWWLLNKRCREAAGQA